MKFWNLVHDGVVSIWQHKMRSFLTLLGIILAVTCSLVSQSLTRGVFDYVDERLSRLQNPPLILFAQGGRNIGFSEQFLKECRRLVSVKNVGFQEYTTRYPMLYPPSGKEPIKMIEMVNTGYFLAKNLTFIEGNYFSEEDLNNKAPVVVVSQKVAFDLSLGSQPVGKWLQAGSQEFKVIGVCENDHWSNGVYIPYSFARASERPTRVFVTPKDPTYYPSLLNEAKKMSAHYFKVEEADLGSKVHFADVGGFLERFKRRMALQANTLLGVALVSFLVGGIGVMNVMLVVVSERTHEIGLRMSLGATQRDIALQFLLEAIIISVLGSGFGILLGAGVLSQMMSMIPFPLSISVTMFFLSLLSGLVAGVVFGFYPAYQASKKTPVEALRH